MERNRFQGFRHLQPVCPIARVVPTVSRLIFDAAFQAVTHILMLKICSESVLIRTWTTIGRYHVKIEQVILASLRKIDMYVCALKSMKSTLLQRSDSITNLPLFLHSVLDMALQHMSLITIKTIQIVCLVVSYS